MQGYTGLYLDANAISPQRATRIGERMAAAGAALWTAASSAGRPGSPTAPALSVRPAGRDRGALPAGPLETVVIGDEIGKASALKMCYAAYSKGSTALLCAVVAAAEQLGVREDLNRQWAHDDARSPIRMPAVCAELRPRRGASPARWTRSRRPSARQVCPASFTRRPPRSIAAWRDSRTRLPRHRWTRFWQLWFRKTSCRLTPIGLAR